MKTKHQFFWIMKISFLIMIIITSIFAQAVSAAIPADQGLFVTDNPNLQEIVILNNSDKNGIAFEVNVPWEQLNLETVTKGSENYTGISLDDWAKTTQQGSPEIPFLIQQVGVPFDVSLSIQVKVGKAHTYKISHPVIPVATQEVDWTGTDHTGGPEALVTKLFLTKNPEIYAQTSPFPGDWAKTTQDGTVRQQRVVGIGIFPIQYYPQANEIVIYETLQVNIKFNAIENQPFNQEYPESPTYESFLQASLLNYDSAVDWRQLTTTPITMMETSTEDENFWQPPNPSWRLKVNAHGPHKVRKSDLSLKGWPESVNADTIQVFNQGEEVAIQVTDGGDGLFNADTDAIIFFGQDIQSKYALDNVYWITYGQATGLRMNTKEGTPGDGDTPSSINTDRHWEENIYYQSRAVGNNNIDNWLWDFITPSRPLTFNFEIASVASGPVVLRTALWGLTSNTLSPDHQVQLFLNSTKIGDFGLNAQEWINPVIEIPDSLINSDNNIFTIKYPDDYPTYAVVYIDWLELEFASGFVPEGDILAFSYDQPGTWDYQIDGFTTDQITIFDVSSPNQPVWIENPQVTASALGYQVTFQDHVDLSSDYWVGSPAGFQAVTAIEPDTPSNLQSPDNAADHIIITHADFITSAQTLGDYRASQGYRSVVVDVQDIYDEFGYGIPGATPIHDFLAYTYTNWESPAPSYVVLIGDGHYDPKYFTSPEKVNFIPPYLESVDPWIGETAADNRFVTLVGDDLMPDMMLGRLSVNTPQEADAFVDKIMNYEQTPPSDGWQSQMLAVADDADTGGNFPLLSDNLLSCCIPPSYTHEKVYYGTTHTDAASATSAILSAINAGKLFVNFIGHGYTSGWTDLGLLRTDYVDSLTNAIMPTIILAMTCKEGYFINPTSTNGLGEVITRAEGKGAVASWSPTGNGVVTGHDFLNRGFYNAFFIDGVDTIGEAIQAGKFDLWSVGGNLDLLDTYILFGDPATVMLRPIRAKDDAYAMEANTALEVPSPGILDNDLSFNSDPLTITLVSQPTYGELLLNPDGGFTYTPLGGFAGTDQFDYRMGDGDFLSNLATVTIAVSPGSVFPPVVSDIPNQTIDEGNTFTTINLDDYVSDADNTDAEIAWSYSGNTDLTVSIDSGRIATITTPDENWFGSETITFRAADPDGFWDEDSATFTVTSVNDAPIVGDIPDQTINQGGSFTTINLDDYVTDVDNSDLQITWTYSGNTHLTISIDINHIATIDTPDPDWNGVETITFKAIDPDGLFDSDAATFTVKYVHKLFLPLITN